MHLLLIRSILLNIDNLNIDKEFYYYIHSTIYIILALARGTLRNHQYIRNSLVFHIHNIINFLIFIYAQIKKKTREAK